MLIRQRSFRSEPFGGQAMPGAYAHITLVNLAKVPRRMEASGFPPEASHAVLQNSKFLEVGAVSPDYPYLVVGDADANRWADRMHYQNTGAMLVHSVEAIRELTGAERAKAFTWLLGYAAHIAGDLTIHPIVELKVGPYKGNEKAHRTCEMHQDAHVFRRLNIGEIGLAEHLDAGIWACCDAPDSGRLDQAPLHAWNTALSRCYPADYTASRPNISQWHGSFKRVVDSVEEGGKLFPFARHVAASLGWCYPSEDQVDPQFIKGLKTPEGPMDYDPIFDRAIANALAFWGVLARAVYANDGAYKTAFKNWNLDTGRDEAGSLQFWRQQ